MSNPELTQARLKALLHYDPETGEFTRIARTSNRIRVGDVAGTPATGGYIGISVGSRIYRAHRLAYFYMTGAWPENDVDHINGIRTDNRWVNLRDVSRRTNMENLRGAMSSSSTGLLGVSPKKGRFVAQITVGGKVKHLGYFTCPHMAHQAYLTAKREHHAGCTL